jgi:hypothetical protein
VVHLITVDSLTFDAEDRSVWSAIELQGWLGSPPMRVREDDRPNADGAFGSVRNYRAARPLRLRGVLEGGSFALQQELQDRFAAIQADGVPFTLSVENDLGVRSLTVTLQGEAEVVPDPDFRGATVSARFLAYDPVKYGPEVSYSTGLASGGGGLEYPLYEPSGALYYGAVGNLGRVTVTNAGTADTWPVFEVSGQLDDGFFIQCLGDGSVLRYDRVVPAGTTVTIDSRTGAVLIDGVSDASTYLTRDQFFSIPANGSCDIQFNAISSSSGTPTMTVTARSGWW